MSWTPTSSARRIVAEFDRVFPNRSRASDGIIGDVAHAASISGHNPDRTGRAEYRDGDALDEVRAVDITADLRSTVTMENVVQHILADLRAGIFLPFEYIIYRSRIWSRSDAWGEHRYTGSNPHASHAHFSGRYSQAGDEWDGELGLAELVKPKPPKPSWESGVVAGMKTVDLSDTGRSVIGADVCRLQGLLLAAGYGPAGLIDSHGHPDGIGGPATRKALGSFQAVHRCGRADSPATPDYVAGKVTWSKLLGV